MKKHPAIKGYPHFQDNPKIDMDAYGGIVG